MCRMIPPVAIVFVLCGTIFSAEKPNAGVPVVTLESVSAKATGPGEITADFACKIDASAAPEILAAMNKVDGARIQIGGGKTISSATILGMDSPSKLPENHVSRFTFHAILPENTTVVSSIEGTVSCMKGTREILTWKDPANSVDTSKPSGKCVYTLGAFDDKAGTIGCSIRVKIPDRQMYYLFTLFEPRLRFNDGGAAVWSPSGGGGLGDEMYHYDGKFTSKGKPYSALEVTVISDVTRVPVGFVFKDVKMPPVAKDPRLKVPIGARGPRSVTSDGFTFTIQKASMRDPYNMEVNFNVLVPAGLNIVAGAYYLCDIKGEDDLKKPLRTNNNSTVMGPIFKTLRADFMIEPNLADRVTFSGTYKVLVSDESAEIRFQLPADKLDKPLTNGPFTVTGLNATKDFTTIQGEIRKNELPESDLLFNTMSLEALDAAGQLLSKRGGSMRGDKESAAFSATFRTDDDHKVAVLVVHYMKKGRTISAPVQFANIGIPRIGGKPEYDGPVNAGGKPVKPPAPPPSGEF